MENEGQGGKERKEAELLPIEKVIECLFVCLCVSVTLKRDDLI